MNKALSFGTDLGAKMVILAIALSLLPKSPFQAYVALTENIRFISYVNWFVPIAQIIEMIQIWLLAVSVYYSILFIARYSNLVKG